MRSSKKRMARGRRRLATLMALTSATVIGCEGPAVSPDQASPPAAGGAVLARAGELSGWSDVKRVDLTNGTHPDFNTSSTDGCPFISRDGKTFYMASNRDITKGLDIWVSTRASETDGWSLPANVETVNTTADDFCPTISRDGHLLY